MEHWFDDLWVRIPDSYIIYTRGNLDEKALENIRKEFAALEAASGHHE